MKPAALCLLLALSAPLAAEPRHDIVVLAERERPHLVRFTATLEPLRQADLALVELWFAMDLPAVPLMVVTIALADPATATPATTVALRPSSTWETVAPQLVGLATAAHATTAASEGRVTLEKENLPGRL